MLRAVILVAALVFVASPCLAVDQPTTPQEKQLIADCSADALRFCKLEILQGREAITACMRANRSKLQSKCSRHL